MHDEVRVKWRNDSTINFVQSFKDRLVVKVLHSQVIHFVVHCPHWFSVSFFPPLVLVESIVCVLLVLRSGPDLLGLFIRYLVIEFLRNAFIIIGKVDFVFLSS